MFYRLPGSAQQKYANPTIVSPVRGSEYHPVGASLIQRVFRHL
jgi:hypothetical protein